MTASAHVAIHHGVCESVWTAQTAGGQTKAPWSDLEGENICQEEIELRVIQSLGDCSLATHTSTGLYHQDSRWREENRALAWRAAEGKAEEREWVMNFSVQEVNASGGPPTSVIFLASRRANGKSCNTNDSTFIYTYIFRHIIYSQRDRQREVRDTLSSKLWDKWKKVFSKWKDFSSQSSRLKISFFFF